MRGGWLTRSAKRPSDAPRVIFILGWGRSGSTLLGNILGELEGCVSVGELHDLWASFASGYSCGCGSPLPDCPFWQHVASSDRAVAHALSKAELWHERKARLIRVRHIPRIMLNGPWARRDRSDLGSLSDVCASLYRAVGAASGASIVVDSGKTPAVAALLLRMPVEVSFVHLVRDPRATGFSWRRTRFADSNGSRRQVRLGYGRNAVSWMTWNIAAEFIRRRVPPESWVRVRYEDFVTSPEDVVRQLSSQLRLPMSGWPLRNDHTVELGVHHTVEGNPGRFRTGLITIQADDEWSEAMSTSARLATVAVTAPLFVAYGYRP